VYDGSGDDILTYTAGVGWQEKKSKAETEVHGPQDYDISVRTGCYDSGMAGKS